MKNDRPLSTQLKPIKKRKSNPRLEFLISPEEMYKLSTRQLDLGIEGYEIPRKYNDHHQCIWVRKREKILSAHKHIWPPEDWPKKKDSEEKVKPQKRTFLEDIYKWCYSYYDQEKAEKVLEKKEINLKDYVKPLAIDKQRRKNFLENEKKKEEWKKSRPKYYDYMQNFVDVIVDKIKTEENEKIDYYKLLQKKYQHNPKSSRCDKISILSEAQYMGEQYPFYNTYVPQGEELDKNKLFFPSKKPVWKKAPVWSYPKDIGPNVQFRNEEKEKLKEKLEEYMSNKDLNKEDIWINVVNSFHRVNHHGELKIKFEPDYKLKETEQYLASLEKNPKKYVGPQHYWKMPKETFSRFKRAAKPNLSSLTDDNGNKIYYMDRKKTDKRIYSAGMRKAVY